MFVRQKKRSNGKIQIQIVESVRTGKTVNLRVIRSLGVASTQEEINQILELAEAIIVELKNARKPVLTGFNPFELHLPKKRKALVDDGVLLNNLTHVKNINDGIVDVFGKIFDSIGFHHTFGTSKKSKHWLDILKANVLARIANPISKRATSSYLFQEMALTIPLDRIYRMMDKLVLYEKKIKQAICLKTKSIFPEKVDILFFDVTTLYFESTSKSDLKNFGFSKDCKFKEVQVVLALVATTHGLPITYKLFPGNTFEGHTLIDAIKELKTEYQIENVLMVADRGMFNENNLKTMENEGISFIVAAKIKSMPKALKEDIQKSKNYRLSLVGDELHWVSEHKYKYRRLIVSYSNKRASKDRSDRERLIDRLMKKVREEVISVKELIPNQGTKKYLKVLGGIASINHEKIEEDQKWDGLHAVITNQLDSHSSEILDRYRGLWQIEEAFRLNKHSLKMRPIYHWSDDRIKAHILICYIAYAVSKLAVVHLKQKNHPISLEELRKALNGIESIVLENKNESKKYVMPSKLNPIQKKIYSLLEIKRISTPFPI